MSASAVSISHLSKDFRVGMRGVKLRAVDGVSLEIEKNQIFGLLGPNGSGKSTVMKLLLGLLEPTAGQCAIFGIGSHDIASRKEVGFLPEAPYFHKFLTGTELVEYYAKLCAMPRSKIAERTREVLAWVGLENAAARKVGTYSKGMLQRIGVAQALVHDPQLLVLDEPTAGVDPIGFERMATLLMELKRAGKTIFLCSHLLAQVETLCDRIAIMDRGKLVIEGAVDVLLDVQQQERIVVENVSAAVARQIRVLVEQQGGSVVHSEAVRLSLDALFLQHVHASVQSTEHDKAQW